MSIDLKKSITLANVDKNGSNSPVPAPHSFVPASPSSSSHSPSPPSLTIEIPAPKDNNHNGNDINNVKRSPSTGFISSALSQITTRARALSGADTVTASPPSPRLLHSPHSPHSQSSPLATPSPPSPISIPPRRLTSSTSSVSTSALLSQNPSKSIPNPILHIQPSTQRTPSPIPPLTTPPALASPSVEDDDAALSAPIWSVNFLGSEIRLDPSFSAYAVYKIEVILNTQEWKIFRRYNQFYELDMKLRELFPKEKIPRVPPKHFLRSAISRELVEERKELLQKYVDELLSNHKIASSTQVIQWFYPNNDPPFASLDNPTKTGFLMKEGHVFRSWKRRFFILKDGVLYYFKRQGEAEPVGMIPVIGSTLRAVPDNKLRLEICHTGDEIPSLVIQAQDETELREWTDAINTSQVLYSNLENGIPPPPSPDIAPFNPPIYPLSSHASRELLLSPRTKSAPNAPLAALPVRASSQPVLLNSMNISTRFFF